MSAGPETPMVGRQRELEILLAAFEAGRIGHPRVIMVRGEEGIGKTTLLGEFRRRVTGGNSDPPTVLEGGHIGPPTVLAVGQCIDDGEIGTPFTPIRRMLRDLYRGVGDSVFRSAIGSPAAAAWLGTLLPVLAEPVPAVEPVSDAAITDAIETLLEELSLTHHLVLLMEDIHWSDAATLRLLRTLAGTLRGRHMTIVMTYRTHHLDRSHPLGPVLAELARNSAVTGFALERLSEGEATALVHHLAPTVEETECAVIVARSQGVPFFVEELTAARGAELPDTLRAVILARYHRLSLPCRETIDLLSVGGVEVDHSVVRAAYPGDDHELDLALREAVSANVIVIAGSRYAFRHGLIQQAIQADLLPSVRSQLHRAYAVGAQAQVDAGDLSAAHSASEHWLAAGEQTRAFDAAITARIHARDSSSPVTAALLGERLLDLWPQVPDAAARVGVGRRELAAEVTEHWSDIGQHDRAVTVAQAALAQPPDGDSAASSGHLHLALTRPLFYTGRRTEGSSEARAAMNALSASNEPQAKALLSRAQATAHFQGVTSGDVNPTDSAAITAMLEVARSSQDPDSVAFCRLIAAWIDKYRGDFTAALDSTRDVLSTSGISHIRHLNGRLMELDLLNCLRRFDETVSVGQSALGEAIAQGRGPTHGSHLATKVASALLASGRPGEALPLIEKATRRLPGSPMLKLITVRTLVGYHSWNDDPASAAAVRGPAHLVRSVCAQDPEELVAWAITDVEAALLEVACTPDTSRQLELCEQALATASVLVTDIVWKWVGLRRELLFPAAWAVSEASRRGSARPLSRSLSTRANPLARPTGQS